MLCCFGAKKEEKPVVQKAVTEPAATPAATFQNTEGWYKTEPAPTEESRKISVSANRMSQRMSKRLGKENVGLDDVALDD
jgi:hypothetical protein